MAERLLTVDEVAARLQCHPHTVRRWIWSRKLRAVKVGDLVRIPQEEVARMMQPSEQTPHKGPAALLRVMQEVAGTIDPADVELMERAIKAAEQPADWSDPLA